MSIVIGGHGLGLQDGSLGLLNRGDPTSNGTLDQRMQAYANVSDGNLVIQERDAFLPSRGEDFELVRTYNSRGKLGGGANWGWTWSTSISLSSHNDKLVGQSGSVEAYLLSYGDGSTLHFDLDAARNLWVATDGAGAYETLQVVKNPPAGQPAFTVTRADQTQILFDKIFTLTAIVDSNGVRTDFDYQGARLTRVRDDTGHVLNYQYSGSDLVRIVDEQNVTLVQYGYSAGQLISVTDRFGHVTTYTYVNNLLAAIDLPRSQVVNGQVQTFDPRRISFTYQELTWPDSPHVNAPIDTGPLFAVSEIVDPLGGKTTFDYNLRFASSMSAADRDARYHPVGSSYFTGGSTRVVDALGQSIDYSYDADGYLTAVVDQQGFQTTYTYGGKSAGDAQSVINQDNLLSIVDRNGSGATTSDSAYFRALRKDLGFAEFVASLTAANKTALLAKFTTKFTYDDRGNLLTQTDGLGNQTRYTYTSFNKVASMTAAMGNALASSDEAQYQQKRVELGYAALVGGLTPAHQDALRALYTTTNAYDAKQNLITRTDPGGDVTKFEYDVFGNLSKRIVYLDPNDLLTESKQQVTTYAYDGFGNNTSIIDGLGHTTFKTFDHFGNVLTSVDGRRGVTTFTYDADNRLLSAMDPEGHTTINTYDAVGNRISVTDANGHTITQVFDRNNLLIATIDPAVSDALTRTTRFTYDILGNNTETIDAEGRKHTYTFDSRRLLLDVATPGVLNDAGAPPVSYHTTYAYDGESNIVTLTDNNNNVTQTLYSANGLLKRVTDPIGNVTEYLYDANRQQVQVTIGAQQLMPALRRVLKFGRDEEDQLARTTDALGNVTEYLYDAPGTVASVTDANGNTTEFEYDKNNRMITETRASVIDPVTGLPTRYTVRHQYDANGNEVRTTDENYTTDDKGHFTTFSFDKDNRVVMVTDGNGIKTVFSYDARDNQTQIAIGVQAHLDADAHVVIDEVDDAAVTSFAYDEFNQLVSTTDAVGNALVGSDLELYQGLRTELGFAALVAGLSAADKTTLLNRYTERYEYDRVGNRTKLTDHLGRVTALSYDALDRLQSRTEAVGTPEQRSAALRYDGNANLVKQTDALGRTTELSYDGNDRLVGETDPLRAVTRHEYDHVGNLTASTEAFGSADARTTRFVYDLNNRLTQESDPEGHLRHYEYDAVGNRLKETDDRGGATEYVYDALNRTIKIIDPIAPFQTRFEYDGVGNTIKIIDPNGGIERMQYDGANRYIQTTDPMGRVMRLKYDVLDRVITQTTAFGLAEAEETRYVYDAEGNLRQVTDAAGNDSTQGFDEVYNLTRHTDNNGHTTTTAFDALNRQIRVTDALDGVTTYSYDLEDNRLTETDPLKRKRSFQYDAKDRLITQTDALGVQTTYAYDALDNRVRITRAANTADARTDTFDYNSDDKLIRQTDALGHVTTYAYDANHNVVSMKDANGHTTTYLYDAANRVTLIKDPLGNDTEYKYDGKGNRTQVLDARGNAQTTYYNGDDEVILTVDGEGNALAHSYDGNGNVIATRRYMTPLPLAGVMDPTQLPIPAPTPRPEDRITRFGYDQLNRLIERTDALGGISTMAYDAVGNKIAETDQNEHTTQYVYDDLDRLITQIDPLEGERSFTYDAVGNRLSVTDENDHTRSFVYDLKDRLVEETDPLDRVRTHTYDARDNRLSTTDENGHITRYAYDLDDRLISQTDPLGGVQTFTYDAVGNQTSVTDQNTHTTRFEYDADDRLISQTNPLGGVRTTVYDAVDNIVAKIDENIHTTTYAYDRNNRLVTETDALHGAKSIAYDAVGNQLSMTDENGHATSYVYDANDRLIQQTDELGGERGYSYDAAGNQLSMTDENGHATNYLYDANDRLITQTDALGGERRFTYDAVGNLLSMTDENGHATNYLYDDNDRLITQTDALGGERLFTYDAVGNRLSMTDENGHATTYAYDVLDRLIQQTDPLDGVRTMIYDAVGNMLSAADENGHATNYLYDANDRLITQTDALGGKRTFAYDAVGNQLSMTDENGHATNYLYDANDRLIQQTDALDGERLFTYDAVGNRLSSTDENGHATSYVYDANDRLISQTDPLGGKRVFAYDALGNQLSMTDENGHATSYLYDATDRLITQTDPLLGERRFTYDAAGNLRSTTDENGHATNYLYDANDRLIQQIDPLGGERLFTYDAVGNRLSATDENGHATSYVYDVLDRLILQIDPLLGERTFAYDAVGNQLSMIDENGRTTTYAYDVLDRLIQQIDPLGGERTFAYDAVGNQLSMTDENGHATSSVYDVLDRLIQQIDPLGGERLFTYDAVGNQLSSTDENGHATSYVYDANDRLITQIDPRLGARRFTYDAAGNLRSTTDENGHTTRFAYDANDRLSTQIDPLLGARRYTYDAAGNLRSTTDENGHATNYLYDANDRLIQQTDALGGERLFTYDAVGNRLSATDENGHATSYVYDVLDRLILQIDPLLGERTFAYDAVGNQLSMIDENGRTTTYAYDVLDRLIQQIDPLGGERTFAYDAVGNQLTSSDESGRTTTYAYDVLDRLIQQTDPLGGKRLFTYDAVGNRLSSNDENGHATSYLYDAKDRLIQEIDPLLGVRRFSYDAIGNRLAMTDESGHTTSLVYDANDRLITQVDALLGERQFIYDAAGNRLGMTDENGHTTSYVYDANDRLITQIDPLLGERRFTYDAVGNKIAETDQNRHTTQYVYDALDRLIQQIDPLLGERRFAYDAVGNLLAATDENDHTTSFAYDVLSRVKSQIDPLGGERLFTYDAVGNRLTATDENNRTTSFAYDVLDRMTSQTDALGNSQVYTYDAVGNRLTATDEKNRTTSFAYDANDRLTTQINPLLGERRFTYDAVGNLRSATDENDHATSYVYDANDRLITQIDPRLGERRFTYDAAGNLRSTTDENDHATSYVYDANDRLITQTDALGGERRHTYDAVGNQASMTDENGHATNYVYDANDRLITQIDPLGGKRRFTYDAVGNRLSATDENNHTISFAYDVLNRMKSQTDALGNAQVFTYDAVGNQLDSTDENGHTTSFAYDVLDRLIQQTDPLDGKRTFAYDAVGNQLTSSDESGRTTTYAYDVLDRLIQQTDPLGGKRTFAYDAVGNQLGTTDENGHTTSFAYDALDRLTSQTDALGKSQVYTYDAADNRLSATDENGHTTSFVYDAIDRLIRQTDPLGGVMSRAYDAAGNKESETDANGDTTTYTYDANNRELSRTDALGATASCIYDAAGNKVAETDANGHATTYAYDALNRLTSMVDALGFATSLRYDAVGNILATGQKLSLTNPSLEQINRHAYDALDRRVSSLSAEGFLKLFEYDAVGQLVKMTAFDNKFAPTAAGEAPLTGSGASRITVSSYDANDRLVSETSPLGFVTRYEYDAVGNRTAMTEAQGTAEARRTETHYDALNRTLETVDALGIVTHIVRDAAGNALEVHEAFGTPAVRVMHYQYDANDRLSQQTDALGVVSQFGYDGVGNLTERRAAVGLAEARTERFEYDANRRQTAQINGEGERTEYAYDGVGNRTTLIVAPGTLEQRINRFRYDADNRLIGETDGNGVETQYQYDGADNKVKTIQLAATYDSAGNPTGTYQGQPIIGKQRETLFAYDLDNRLTQVTDPMGGVTEYEVDALGNRTRITDAQGTQTLNTFDALGRLLTNWVQGAEHGGVLVTNRYDAFGNILETRRGFHDGADTRQTTYTYDQRNRQTTITEHDKVDNANAATVFSQAYSAVFEYDAFDNQTKVAQGVYRLTAADAGYDAAKAALAHPLIAAFSYDRHNELLASTDGVGNILAYENDAHGNRVSQTTGFGTLDARTVTFSYDRADRLIARRTPATGGVVKLSYDEAGNQSQKDTLQSGSEFASPVWVSERFAYDGNGRVVSQSDGLGVITEHVLDAFGNETATRFAAGTDDERTVRFEYNANNDLTAEIDALSNRTRFEVDKLGNRIAQTDALGFVTRLYYNALNQQIAALDAEGFLTTFSRDSAGNVLEIDVYLQQYAAPADHRTPPTPSALDTARVTRNEFDGAGNRVRKTEPDQRVKDFVYDSAGKLRQITDHGSSLAGALALTVDASPRVQRFEYDGAGRMTRFTQVDGVTEDYLYDSANNKTRETVTNPHALAGGGSDPLRTTEYRYDADNRQTAQIFDPGALNQTQTLAYDKAGNVIAKTDALGHVTTLAYDLANRVASITEPLNATTSFGYDRVGNGTSTTDALGNVTRFEYDLNNRVTKAIQPAVDVFTIRDGLQTNVHPIVETKYDAAGNVVQTIDANGFKTTTYFDGNRNPIAEINGDNVLWTFDSDAGGLRTRATLYMTRVDAAAHDSATPPAIPGGEVRTITSEYDAAGRLTRTVFPAIEKTTLTGIDTADPIETVAVITPEETHAYNAFGERVHSIGGNGQISYAYFDTRGRAVATVDSAGYLIESAYDDQGNVVQQRRYATQLNAATLSAGIRPAAPAGDVFTVDRTYDAANRLIEERSPPVAIDGVAVPERIVTRYVYDANGNQTSRTLAADSPEAATEYSYYDAANRRVAIVNDARILHHVGYDANGNQTLFKRFIDPVSGSVDLSTATLGALLADITPDATQDQETRFLYDALNRESLVTDLMGPGASDDITRGTKYDANGNASLRTDPEGFVSQTAYDALGHVTQTRTPDGNRSFVEFDAAGSRIRAWTGDLGSNQATAANNVTASIGSALSVAWEVSGNQLTSYLVYDTAAHDVPPAYASESGQQGSGAVSVDVALAGFSAGSLVYFRVVTVDAAGSTAWTDEFSITVPVLMSNLSIAQAGSDLEVTARFNGAVISPQLLFGTGQALNNTVAFTLQGDGSYKAIILSPAQGGQGLSFQVRWTANGSTFTTAATPFEAPGAHEAIDGTFIWPVPLPAQGDAEIVLLGGARQESAFQVNGQLQFTPAALATGTHVYQVLYGQSVAESHGFTVTNRDHQTTGAPSAPVVIPGGMSRTFTYQHNYSTHIEAVLDPAEAARAAATLRVAYRAAGNTGLGGFTNAAVTRNVNTFSADAALAPGDYDIKVSYTHDGQEVIVQWRRITVEATALHAPTVQQDTDEPFNFAGLPSSFIHDVSTTALTLTGAKSMTVVARETDGEITQPPSPNANVSIDPGLYTGPVDPASTSFTLPVTTTASAPAGSAKADGLTASTYFTEIEYNALGIKIASNEDSGLWRRFGVDAGGNIIATRVYGSKADEVAGSTPIVTYSAYDARNLEITRFAAKAGADANGDGIDETSTRGVSRATYDYAGRKLTQLDANPGALAQAFAYDGVGNLIRETDGMGFATLMFYDRRGNEVRRVDARGFSPRFVYDAAGRKVQEIDALNNPTTFAYDGFDRQTSKTDALGHTSQMAYDQHDRLVQTTDANGNSTKYSYDKRDNRTWTEDANHHFFGQGYDAMGRVTHAYSFQSRTSGSILGQALIDAFNITPTPTTLAQAIDAVGNAASLYRPALVNETIAYDIYGNKRSETDAEGRTRFYTNGAFGRLTQQTDESGRVTTFGYDRFGRLISETRPKDATVTGARNVVRTYDDNNRVKSVSDITTQVSTTYTYDVAGERKHETVKAPTFFQVGPIPTARNLTYQYDGLGRMVQWSDSVVNKTLGYAYDAVGNQTRIAGSDAVDHRYSFDANNRVIDVRQGASTPIAAYTYDAAGNRKTYNDGLLTATYTYDAGDRVVRADITPNATPANPIDDSHMTWQYDAVGNVTQYRELAPFTLTVKLLQTSRYTANNRTQQTSIDDQRDPDAKSIVRTLNALDKSGRVLIEGKIDSSNPDDVTTTTYTHVYSKDGRELSITATGTGDKTGNTKATFDANDRLVKLDLGKGNNQDSNEFRLFISNNDGQILRRLYDDGDDDTTTKPTTQFLYANGHPVGETGTKTDGSTGTVLDKGNYSLLNNMGADFPAASVSEYSVRAGDTLQSIAAQLYGNPSLWFVIADANGLTGSEQLKAGTRLSIPNGTDAGRLTAETHKVYDESEIVGSKLPNLKSPPSSPNICAIIGAIILAIILAIIAVVITIVSFGLAIKAGIAIMGANVSLTSIIIAAAVVSTAVGVVVGAAASAATQGIQIAFGLQKEFDWKQLLSDALAGGIGGLGAAFGGAATVLTKAGQLVGTAARIAKVVAVAAETVLEVAGEAATQAIVKEGRIDQPWMLAASVAGGIGGELIGTLGSRAIRAIKGPKITGIKGPRFSGAEPSTSEVTLNFKVPIAEGTTDINAKSLGDIGKASDDGVAATLKDVDTELSSASAGDKATLDIKLPSESLDANNNTASLKPLTVSDNTNSTLSIVQSPLKLDEGVGLGETLATKKMISGETSGFDQKSVANFDEGAKVEDKTVPIDHLNPAQKAPVDVNQDAVLTPQQRTEQTLQRLLSDAEKNGLRPASHDAIQAAPTDVRYRVPRNVADARLPKPVKQLIADTLDYNETKTRARMKEDFLAVFDVEDTGGASKGKTRYRAYEDKIKETIKTSNMDADTDTLSLVALRGYTEAYQINKNKFAQKIGASAGLNDPVSEVAEDYVYLNAVKRGKIQGKKAKAFDAYIRLATEGLDAQPGFTGTVYRGGEFDDEVFAKLFQGKEGIYSDAAFSSTTKDAGQAFKGNTLLVINSRGAGGREIERFSALRTEAEVLFGSNSRFKVMGIETYATPTRVTSGTEEKQLRTRVVYLDELTTAETPTAKPLANNPLPDAVVPNTLTMAPRQDLKPTEPAMLSRSGPRVWTRRGVTRSQTPGSGRLATTDHPDPVPRRSL